MRWRELAVLLPVLIVGCAPGRDPWGPAAEGKTRVLASFPPLYSFASAVGGDHVDVLCLLTGTGPHDYEATTADARKVAGADVILINGLSLDEAFTEQLVRMVRKAKAKPTPIGDALDKKLLVKMAPHDHNHADDDHHHHHGEFDPHVWLGPAQAQAMVEEVAKSLTKADPAHEAEFKKNAAALQAKIRDLQAYGRERLKDKKSKAIVAQHESLRYFADGLGLEVVGSIQLRPGIEPDASQLARLAELCREKGVGLIAVEPQYGRGHAETLARVLRSKGLDVKIAVVDPIETAVPGARGNPDPSVYLDRMKANIDAVAEALP
jgi:zinc transport system substrate-binding protein